MAAKSTSNNVDEARKKENDAGKQNVGYVVAAIVIFAALAYFALTAAPAGGITPGQGVGNNTTVIVVAKPEDSAAAKLFFSSVDKVANFPSTYSLEFAEKVRNTDVSIVISSYLDGKYAAIVTPYNTRSIYWKGNATVMCELPIDGQKICADVTNDTSTQGYMLHAETLFVNTNTTASDHARDMRLVQWGAMKISSNGSEIEIAGRKCFPIEYKIDYSNLTVSQINELGLSGHFDTVNTTECMDSQFGIPLWLNVSYAIGGQSGSVWKKTLNATAPFEQNISMPQKIGGLDALKSMISKTEASWQIGGACGALNGTDADTCYRQGAADSLMSEYCTKVQNQTSRELCYATVAVMSNNATICSNSGNMSDDCAYQVAVNWQNAGACSLIANQTGRAICANATAKKTNVTG